MSLIEQFMQHCDGLIVLLSWQYFQVWVPYVPVGAERERKKRGRERDREPEREPKRETAKREPEREPEKEPQREPQIERGREELPNQPTCGGYR